MKLLDILNKKVDKETVVTIDHEQQGDYKERMVLKTKTLYEFYKNGRIKLASGCVIKYTLPMIERIHISTDEGIIYILIEGGDNGIKLKELNELCHLYSVSYQYVIQEIEKRFKPHDIFIRVPGSPISNYSSFKSQ